ncbi:DNA mismatch repair ATPase MutS [Chitinophaga terrae (ex Kim and Jung 2007)]|uniref:MutS-related protein n=1 Tax=Chitinophaga terrae (ex Kim and Jung 2007) TaxID=408074 RepID=UPI0027846DC2|nr:DNA mismatch repair protein [Chitinophaga terrae (ex Kim and Jung 2007)]MDQ0106777.1 DNA mismatch repair ATPase MutS [Chitinophaga terrae (ex Kim and Jung 2007)]
MILHTDDQTIEDLRIFGKRDSKGIYDLYNHTRTRGGEAILKEMFLKPLSDREQINRRSNIIEHFAKNKVSFPFNASLFDMAEKYLANADAQTRNATRNAVLSEKDVNNGVSSVIELVQQVRAFIDSAAVRSIAAYEEERKEIDALLSDPAFDPVHAEKNKGKLSYAAVTAYDLLFRTRERSRVEKLMQHVYNLDVFISVANVAAENQFVFPEALEEGDMLLLEGVYHPGVKNAVGNSITMNATQHVIFLTGANMAGKSTFLRSLSTAVYLAHMGFPVAAKRMQFRVLDGIYTTINLPDNLGMGASHFYAEVLRVKKIAGELHAGKSLLVIFDELFRGTNVKDAHEATVAVTGAFTERKNSLFVISSHIVEAGEDLKQYPGTGFLYLPTRMNGLTPEYTYTLERGITDDRHGMIIIRNEGILDVLKNGHKRALDQ